MIHNKISNILILNFSVKLLLFNMSYNIEMKDTENTNEWINWIEEAIDKEHLKYYEYKQFSNIEKIGTGGFGNVFRANWKNLDALKSRKLTGMPYCIYYPK